VPHVVLLAVQHCQLQWSPHCALDKNACVHAVGSVQLGEGVCGRLCWHASAAHSGSRTGAHAHICQAAALTLISGGEGVSCTGVNVCWATAASQRMACSRSGQQRPCRRQAYAELVHLLAMACSGAPA